MQQLAARRQDDREDAEDRRLLYVAATRAKEKLVVSATPVSSATARYRCAGGWRGWAFIGSERDAEPSIIEQEGVYAANRWLALGSFISELRNQGAALDVRTAVVVDIDKTALGARGRNDGAIDRARVAAIEAIERMCLAFINEFPDFPEPGKPYAPTVMCPGQGLIYPVSPFSLRRGTRERTRSDWSECRNASFRHGDLRHDSRSSHTGP
jgi:hypothetical protein